MHIAVL
jgi:ankyrin repeat protein